MYRTAGTNLFGQWLEKDRILSDFRLISNNDDDTDFDIGSANLLQVNWSYNIFQYDKSFYLTGDFQGKENQLVKIDLPEDCDATDFETNLDMVGNDYNLYLINKKSNVLWLMDLQKEKCFKKININTESPIENSAKKMRTESSILKVVVTNNSCVCLTTDGNLYQGALPSLLDTSHCVGKICDVRCGYEHFILLTDEGKVYTWGNGRRLQLGHGGLENFEIPTEVEALSGIKFENVCAGGWHCLALSEYGDLYSWGWNDTGQLGVNHLNKKGVLNREGLKSFHLPALIDILDDDGEEVDISVRDIACGSRHSAIILEDDTVWTTGNNKYGQLGFSPDLHPTVGYFKKAFECDEDTDIRCGPWSTILVDEESELDSS